MESSSGGPPSSWLDVTKTKLLVLTSLLGIGSIIYFTKNYLERGYFIPPWSKDNGKSSIKQPKVIGGTRSVVIKEELNTEDGVTKKVMHRQRSRQSSTSSRRRSSISNSIDRRARSATLRKETIDVNLNNAINEITDSVKEVEEILGINSGAVTDNKDHTIEEGIDRLRKLIDFAQDVSLVSDRTADYVLNHQEIIEEIVPSPDIEAENFEVPVEEMFYMDDDYDSDDDSFVSATESVDLEMSDDEEYENAILFSMKLKELISKHSRDDFYMQGIEFLTHYGVPVRSLRNEMLDCDNDVDFCVKVYCLRRAFTDLLKNDEHKKWFVESGKEMLITLLKKGNYDHMQFSLEYDKMVNYCSNLDNWGDIDVELTSRGVCNLNFYDIVLDLLIMDSFEDLEDPPSAVVSAIQNRWLSERIKETALSTAIWTVIKTKKVRLENQGGFFARFYDISMYITPLLAWGFLGPAEELNALCTRFKNSMLDFLHDIFSVESVSYKSVQALAEDVLRQAKKHKEELMSAISR